MSAAIVSSDKDRRVKPRYEVVVHAKIHAKLIGSANRTEFITDNISESGLLLKNICKTPPAFNEHTILETWLQIGGGKTLFFFSKFVRYQGDNQLAIRIIDMEPEAHNQYIDFIRNRSDNEVE